MPRLPIKMFKLRLLSAELFALFLIMVIAVALEETLGQATIGVVFVIFVCTAIIYRLFPGSRLFFLSLVNFLAVYACIFVFLLVANFNGITGWPVVAGFLAPIVGFLLSVLVNRKAIGEILKRERLPGDDRLMSVSTWMIPVAIIGMATFFVPDQWTLEWKGWAFVSAMATTALMVAMIGKEVAVFLIDAGLVFEEFFDRMRHLAVPAFAFLTFYSLNVVIFAAIYSIIERIAPQHHFLVNGLPGSLDFPAALHFSLMTFATVGYGDILPATNLIRVIVAAQVISGVLLLLFGFTEIMDYSREHRRKKRERATREAEHYQPPRLD